MIVQNADGSRPEMCGNGLRCVALRLAERDGCERVEYRIDTDAGVRRCEVSRREGSAEVSIDMGEARSGGQHVAPFGDDDHEFQLVSVGNPHAVALDFFPDTNRIDRCAPGVSKSLPDGANVEFVRERAPGAFDVVVWERGVGRTLACGTGAAAVASVLARSGRVGFDTQVELWLPGGRLDLWVAAGSCAVRLRGPARRVFRGVLEDPLGG
jgi:diaminopimelate epimerase